MTSECFLQWMHFHSAQLLIWKSSFTSAWQPRQGTCLGTYWCLPQLVLCCFAIQTSVSETIRKPPLVKTQTAFFLNMAKTIFNMADRTFTPCNVAWSWHWFRQVTALCNVAGGSGITCHGIHPNIRHTGILHLVSSLTISPQSTCHSVSDCKILSKSDQPQQKKMTSCRFSRWRISAILDFRGSNNGFLEKPLYDFL